MQEEYAGKCPDASQRALQMGVQERGIVHKSCQAVVDSTQTVGCNTNLVNLRFCVMRV